MAVSGSTLGVWVGLLGVAAAVAGDHLQVSSRTILLGVLGVGGLAGWLLARGAPTGRIALHCAWIAPVGWVLTRMFC